ncbi:MAG: hypothetical protein AAF503_06715 [Pseudomonadota bacterium]
MTLELPEERTIDGVQSQITGVRMKTVLALSIPALMLAGATFAGDPSPATDTEAPAPQAPPATAPSGHKDRITWPCPHSLATS